MPTIAVFVPMRSSGGAAGCAFVVVSVRHDAPRNSYPERAEYMTWRCDNNEIIGLGEGSRVPNVMPGPKRGTRTPALGVWMAESSPPRRAESSRATVYQLSCS